MGDTADLTAALVAIDSVNPALVPGGAGEGEIARFVAEWARGAGASYWADAAFIAAAGIPTVTFGPRGEGAHAVEEWVSLADTENVARTLAAVARRMCA